MALRLGMCFGFWCILGCSMSVPLSIAAVGSVAAGPIGAAGGFLAGLGFDVAHKFIDIETTGLSEKLACQLVQLS